MDDKALTLFCDNLIKNNILPCLAANYAQLKSDAAKHGDAFFNSPKSAAEFKNDGKGLVSKGEIEAERLIREAFTYAYPDFAICGEELGDEELGQPYAIIIDPVDGTASMINSVINADPALGFGITLGFMKGQKFWGGLIYELTPDQNGQLILGEIYNSWDITPNHEATSTALDTLICTAPEFMFTSDKARSSFHALEKTAPNLITSRNCMGFIDTIALPNACVIEADLSIHDIAALIPICRAAGLKVTDHSSAEIIFKGVDAEYEILAAAPSIHARALDIYSNAGALDIAEDSALNTIATLNTGKFDNA